MTNAQILKDRIKSRCKNQGKEVTTMLENLSLGVNAVNQINEKKGMGAFSLASIADYLECSVDYLLGRTDEPQGKAETTTIEQNHQYIQNDRSFSIGVSLPSETI